MFGRPLRIAPPQEKECQSVVRSNQFRLDVERASIVTNGFFMPPGFREGDGDVLKNAHILWLVAQRQLIGSDSGLEVAVPFEGKPFVQVV